jgi:hypothetical protein
LIYSLLLLLLGRGHAVLYVLERDSEEMYGFTVVNTGEGTDYHPFYRGDYPKVKRRNALRIGDIPRSAILDEALWYFTFKMRFESTSVHGPELLYDVILPMYANSIPIEDGDLTFARNLDTEIRRDRCGDFETIQRSGTCFFRAILSCFRYCLKRVGFSQAQRKQFMFALRICFLFRIINDVRKLTSALEENLNFSLTTSNLPEPVSNSC